MQRDIEYWQDETNAITVEPKTVRGRTVMVEQFPIYSTAKLYKAYLANTGEMRWVFPDNSSIFHDFLNASACIAAQVAA